MFQKQTVKIFSIIAIVLSITGLLISIAGTLFLQATHTFSLPFYVSIVSWGLLLWASIIGFQLCSSYKLDEALYKKIGIRIYVINVAFILFFFIGITLGLIISVAIFVTLWALKSNFDDWTNSEPDLFLENDANENN